MWYGTHSELGWLGWTLMTVGMVAFWGLVVWAVVVLARAKHSGGSAGPTRPEDVLAGRLARGEISSDEYVRSRQLIERRPAPSVTPTSKEVV
jgi:putative membrane protein